MTTAETIKLLKILFPYAPMETFEGWQAAFDLKDQDKPLTPWISWLIYWLCVKKRMHEISYLVTIRNLWPNPAIIAITDFLIKGQFGENEHISKLDEVLISPHNVKFFFPGGITSVFTTYDPYKVTNPEIAVNGTPVHLEYSEPFVRVSGDAFRVLRNHLNRNF